MLYKACSTKPPVVHLGNSHDPIARLSKPFECNTDPAPSSPYKAAYTNSVLSATPPKPLHVIQFVVSVLRLSPRSRNIFIAQDEEDDMTNNCLMVNAVLDKTRMYSRERYATTRRHQAELYIALAVEPGGAFH